MTNYDYDLFVIGAGSGGVRAARIAASHGAKVAIAEEYRYGGTCVIRGCVPKKLLVYASRFDDGFTDARGFGWTVGETAFDWNALIAAKDCEIARLEDVYRGVLDRNTVERFTERAVVTGAHGVRLIASGRDVSARYILIATGGRPNVDAKLPGVEHVITSDEVFHLDAQPKRIVVAGGGYIAVEFASIFAGLGSEVTLLYRGDKVLRGFDEDLRDGVTAALMARGIRIITNAVFSHIAKQGEVLAGALTNGEIITAEQILFAIGRSPNTAGLGLAEAGVTLAANGAVAVDAASCSSVPSIYAVGDVTDRVALTPVAIREGHAFADSIFGARRWTVDYDLIPTAVFTTPEIGTVGLAEHQARQSHAKVVIYKSAFRTMKSTLGGRPEQMQMKMIVDGETDRVLGVHVLGPDAAEIIQMAAVALRLKATKADFDATMALHPSSAEELMTMRVPWSPPVA
jgi:glutathione reductase (NADPH)